MTVVQPPKHDPRAVLLVAIDLSEASRAALKLAGRFAEDSQDLRVEVLHVVDLRSGGTPFQILFESAENLEKLRNSAMSRVEEFVEETIGLKDGLDIRVAFGHPVETILAASEEEHVSLLIMGSTGASALTKVLFGTTASQVLRGALKPTLVVPPDAGDLHVQSVLCPHDFSPESDRAVQIANELVHELDAQILLYHGMVFVPVTPFYPGLPAVSPQVVEAQKAKAFELLEKAASRFGTRVKPLPVDEVLSVNSGILAAAEEHNADIIVMATHGRQGMEHILGSTAERVLRDSTRAVLVVK